MRPKESLKPGETYYWQIELDSNTHSKWVGLKSRIASFIAGDSSVTEEETVDLQVTLSKSASTGDDPVHIKLGMIMGTQPYYDTKWVVARDGEFFSSPSSELSEYSLEEIFLSSYPPGEYTVWYEVEVDDPSGPPGRRFARISNILTFQRTQAEYEEKLEPISPGPSREPSTPIPDIPLIRLRPIPR